MAFASLLLAWVTLSAPAIDTDLLSDRVGQIEGRAGGRLGVGILDLRTGEAWYHRRKERFPMQSLFKLPLALVLFREVEQRRISLKERIVVTRRDLSIPLSGINDRFREPSQTFTIGELLEEMLLRSDNTATDLLMRRLGGPSEVRRKLQSFKLGGISIDRYESELNTQYQGLGAFRPEWANQDALQRAIEAVPLSRQKAALEAYLKDPRDTATPEAFVHLLVALSKGRLLNRSSTEHLMSLLRNTRTGANRFASGLPSGSVLANRTGAGRTIDGKSGAMNQVAIATLPDGRKFVIVALLSGSTLPWDRRESALGEVARAADLAIR